jgi:hypothetical protein
MYTSSATLDSSQSLESKFKMSSATESCGSEESFYDRMPSVEFKPPTPDWGYLAQVNEKFKNVLAWNVERIVGEPAHRAMFLCTPGKLPLPAVDMYGLVADPRLTHMTSASQSL